MPDTPNIASVLLERWKNAGDAIVESPAYRTIMDSILPEWEDGSSVTHSLGEGNPLVEKIWPGGIQVPSMKDSAQEIYNTFIRPMASPLSFATIAAAKGVKAKPKPDYIDAEYKVEKAAPVPASLPMKGQSTTPSPIVQSGSVLDKYNKLFDDMEARAHAPQDVTKRGRLFTALPGDILGDEDSHMRLTNKLSNIETAKHELAQRPVIQDAVLEEPYATAAQRELKYEGAEPWDRNTFIKEMNDLGIKDRSQVSAMGDTLKRIYVPKYSDLVDDGTIGGMIKLNELGGMEDAYQPDLPKGMGWPLISVDSEVPSYVANDHVKFLSELASKTPSGQQVFDSLSRVEIEPRFGGSYNVFKDILKFGIPNQQDLKAGYRPSEGYGTLAHELKHGIDYIERPEIYNNYPINLNSLVQTPDYWVHPAEVAARTEGSLAEFMKNSDDAGQLTFGEDFIRPLAENDSILEGDRAVQRLAPDQLQGIGVKRYRTRPPSPTVDLSYTPKLPMSEKRPELTEGMSNVLDNTKQEVMDFETPTKAGALASDSAAAQKLIELLMQFQGDPVDPNKVALNSRVTDRLIPPSQPITVPKGFGFDTGDIRGYKRRSVEASRDPELVKKRTLQQALLERFRKNPTTVKKPTIKEMQAHTSNADIRAKLATRKGNTKITEEQVRQIRKMYEGGTKIGELQKAFPNINPTTLREIATRVSFTRVKD